MVYFYLKYVSFAFCKWGHLEAICVRNSTAVRKNLYKNSDTLYSSKNNSTQNHLKEVVHISTSVAIECIYYVNGILI